MAKKKPASEASPAPARKRATKSRKPPTPAAGAQPLIDTNQAAAAAARMLSSRAKFHINEQETVKEMGKETPSFKTLKESIEKPASSVTNAMGSAFGPSKSNLPATHTGNQQVAHNQTTSGVGRVNVPRRTAG